MTGVGAVSVHWGSDYRYAPLPYGKLLLGFCPDCHWAVAKHWLCLAHDLEQVGPRPETFGGQRRLVGHRDEPLLFELELVRVRQQQGQGQGAVMGYGRATVDQQGGEEGKAPLFRLPAPPTYYGQGKAQGQ